MLDRLRKLLGSRGEAPSQDAAGPAAHQVTADPAAPPVPSAETAPVGAPAGPGIEPARASILAHVAAHLRPGPGLDPGGDELPDADLLDESRRMWAPGALEGVIHMHARPDAPDPAVVARIADAIRALAAAPGVAARADLHDALAGVDLVGARDDILRALDAAPPEPGVTLRDEVRAILRTSPYRQDVKLALALIAAVGDEADLDTVRTLARHEELTWWAITALVRLGPDPVGELLALAPLVTGWGRIHVVEALAGSSDPRVAEYLIAGGGFRNDVADGYTVPLVAEVTRLETVLARDDLPVAWVRGAAGIIGSLARDAVQGGPGSSLKDWPAGPEAVQDLVVRHGAALDAIEDLQALVAVGRFLDAMDDAEDAPEWWGPDRRAEVRAVLDPVLARPAWRDVVASAVESGSRDDRVAGAAAGAALGMPVAPVYAAMLEEDPRDAYAWQELLGLPTEESLEPAIRLARRHLLDADGRPASLAAPTSGPVSLDMGPFVYQRLLAALARAPEAAPDLVAGGLRGPASVRTAALGTIAAWDGRGWTEEIAALVDAATNDGDAAIAAAAATAIASRRVV